MLEHPQVLVAGGCHVKAYPIGEQYSFGHLAAASAGWDHTSVSKVSLRNPATLLDYLRNHRMPEVVVLQLGNYEAPYPIPRHAKLLFPQLMKRWKTAADSFSSSRGYSAPKPDAKFHWSMAWGLRIWLKQAYAAMARHTNPPLSDTVAMAKHLTELLQKLKQLGVPKIIVLSPLPCADYMACKFRLAASPIFEQACANAGALWADSGTILGYHGPESKRSFDIYVDERHLNLRGHQLLAAELAMLLVRVSGPPTVDTASGNSETRGKVSRETLSHESHPVQSFHDSRLDHHALKA